MTRKLMSMESTYQGYISSTHDALLIFECVRRGILPKVKRRLREGERKYIRSGQVFVFDERESGIKRWTDGLLWSPSRILWNFLVYRQVDKKFGRGSLMQDSNDELNPTAEMSSFEERNHDGAYTISAEPLSAYSDTSANQQRQIKGSTQSTQQDMTPFHQRPLPSWEANTIVCNETLEFTAMPSRKDAQEERNLVGSLRNSYPFAKGGLCKKTISISIDGSTQHLISYYTVEDVRSGRLRTPSTLPEIASLAISPQLLTKTSFRFPPAIIMGPDGVPRFRGEDGSKMDGSDSSEDSVMNGSNEHRDVYIRSINMPPRMQNNQQYSHQDTHIPLHQHHQYHHQGHSIVMMPSTPQYTYAALPYVDISPMQKVPLPHQIGGNGIFQPSRQPKSSDGPFHGSNVEQGSMNKTQIESAAVASSVDGAARGEEPLSLSNEEQLRHQYLQQMLAEQQRLQNNSISQRYVNQQHRNDPVDLQWPQGNGVAMMRTAVGGNNEPKLITRPISEGHQSQVQEEQNESGIDPPPSYMPKCFSSNLESTNSQQPPIYWHQSSVTPSNSVSPLPAHAPLAFVPSQRPLSGQQQVQVSAGNNRVNVAGSGWSQQQPPALHSTSTLQAVYSTNDQMSTQASSPHFQQIGAKGHPAYYRPMGQAMLVQGHLSQATD